MLRHPMSQDRLMERVPKEDLSTSNCPRSFPDVSSLSSREAARRPETFRAASSRSTGHPFKRYTIPSSGVHENGLQKAQYSKKEDWVHLVLNSRELTGRTSRASTTEKGNRSFRRAWFYAVALVVVVCFFVAEAFVQGSVSLLVKGTAAVATEALSMKRFHDLSSKALSRELVLEYKLKFVPWKLNEQFVKQRLALDELRKLPRNSFRRPRLALATTCTDYEYRELP